MTDYAYGAGEWTALAHEGRAALLDPAIDAATVHHIWESMAQGDPLESWLEVLAGNGLSSLPSFGLLEPGPDGVRVVVRGDVMAIVQDYDVSAGGMRTWREHVAPADTGVVLQVEPVEVGYPLIGGIVLAAALQVGDRPTPSAPADGSEETADQPAQDEVVAGESDDDGAAVGAVVAGAAVASSDERDGLGDEQAEAQQSVEGEEPVEGDEAVDAGEQSVEGDEQAAASEQAAETDEHGGEAVDGLADDAESAEGEQPVQQTDGDELVDAAGAGGEAAWAEQAEGVQMENLPSGAEAAGEQPLGPAQESDPWAAPVQGSQSSEWGPPPAYEAGAAPVPGAEQPEAESQGADGDQVGDHDGYTMAATDLPERQEEAVDTTLAPAQDDVGGATEQVSVPAPTLSLSTGQQVELDRPVLIGRAPESSRFGFGDTPRLVTVPSPQQDISRTHVEIKLEGDHVLVTDLRSTNGTVVVLPGSPPRRLHPGESVPVPPSTVVDLGDGVTVVVTAPEGGPQQAY